jgi:hypothetical protein
MRYHLGRKRYLSEVASDYICSLRFLQVGFSMGWIQLFNETPRQLTLAPRLDGAGGTVRDAADLGFRAARPQGEAKPGNRVHALSPRKLVWPLKNEVNFPSVAPFVAREERKPQPGCFRQGRSHTQGGSLCFGQSQSHASLARLYACT